MSLKVVAGMVAAVVMSVASQAALAQAWERQGPSSRQVIRLGGPEAAAWSAGPRHGPEARGRHGGRGLHGPAPVMRGEGLMRRHRMARHEDGLSAHGGLRPGYGLRNRPAVRGEVGFYGHRRMRPHVLGAGFAARPSYFPRTRPVRHVLSAGYAGPSAAAATSYTVPVEAGYGGTGLYATAAYPLPVHAAGSYGSVLSGDHGAGPSYAVPIYNQPACPW